MADWYWTPAAITGGTNVGTAANPYRGFKMVADQIAAGVIQGGDNVYRVVGSGPIAMADRAQFPANTTAETSSLGSSLNSSVHGPMAGTSFGATSLASGIRFFMQSTMTDPAIDGRGVTANSERMQAVLRLRGENIEVHDLCGYTSDWNYIRRSDGTTRIAGTSSTSDAEDRSIENCGLMIMGNGNKVYNTKIDGLGKHSRAALYMAVMVSSNAGSSQYRTNIVDGFEVWGAANGVSVQPQGGGWDMCRGQKVYVRNGKAHTGGWGRETGMPAGGYNAQKHGNGIVVVGKYFGGAEVHDCEVTGSYQDGIVLAGGTSLVGRDCYIHDLGSATNQFWQWNTGTARWELTPVAASTEGNGVKAGLGTYDGTSPTTWLGEDGTDGGSLLVPEVRTVLLRMRIYRVAGIGITTNQGRGILIHACEIDDSGESGISIDAGSRVGNYWLSNNFVRKVDTQPSKFALRLTANARICGMFNNILWSNPAVSGQLDIGWESTQAMPAGMKDKNLLVTGRKSGANYPSVGDLAPQTPVWTQGIGLSAGSSLRGAGAALSEIAKGRCTGLTYGIGSDGSRTRFGSPPNIGPYG